MNRRQRRQMARELVKRAGVRNGREKAELRRHVATTLREKSPEIQVRDLGDGLGVTDSGLLVARYTR